MKIVQFSSHRMRKRGLDFAAVEALVTGDDCPVPVYSFSRDSKGGWYLVSDALAEKIINAKVYVGKSRPSILRGSTDVHFCWGAKPTEAQRMWILQKTRPLLSEEEENQLEGELK